MRSRRARNSASSAPSDRSPEAARPAVPARHRPPAGAAAARRSGGLALAAGCRWVSVREKDLPEDEQIALVRTLLPMTRRHGARLTLHGDAALAKVCGADGVHLSAGSDPAAARALLGPGQADRRVDPHRDRSGSHRSRRRRLRARGAGLRDRRASLATAPRSAARAWARSHGRHAFRSSRSAASMPPGRQKCWQRVPSASR